MRGVSATPASVSSPPAHRPELEDQIRQAGTLTEVLRLRGRGEPRRAHIHLYEENEQLRTITFGELYDRASAVAAGLRQRGLEPAETVAIMLPTCAEFFHTFAGILLAGGIPVPIYPPFRADRISEYAARQGNILRNAEARFLITFRQAEGLARLLRPRVPTLGAVLNAQQIASTAGAPEPAASVGRVATRRAPDASGARRRHRFPAIHLGIDGRSERRHADAREPAREHPFDCRPGSICSRRM